MNSKERVLRAFKVKDGMPDRVPFQFDLCRQLIEHFAGKLGMEADYSLSYYEDLTYRISANDIRVKLGSDIVVVGGTVKSGYTPEQVEGAVTKNEFAMHMKPTDLYVEAVKCPLEGAESEEDIAAYPFPDPFAEGRFDKAKRDIDRFGEEYFVIGDVELSLFELAWHLTGLEKYLIALISGDPWVDVLNSRVEAWTLGLAEQLMKCGVDALWFGEDLGSQTSTLISPDIWRQYFKPGYIRMIKKLREINPDILIIMHSDGAVAPLIDDWIEMGIDVFNPVQPNVPGSDPEELKSKYGDRILFFGGIDQQELLPKGKKEEIRAEIKRRISIFGRNRGYLCAPAHILQADVSPETVLLMLDAVREYGAYGEHSSGN